jgi:micrococcal nuclease
VKDPHYPCRPVFFVLLLCAALSCGAQAQGTPQTRAPQTQAAPAANRTVYVTNSGTKYHISGCSALRNSAIAVSLEDAARSGYEPCAICKPPPLPAAAGQTAAPAGAETRGAGGLYRVNLEQLASCEAAALNRLTAAEVTGHVDGDTIRVRIANPPPELSVVETIRLIGVDTPETVHPKREVEYFGAEASAFTKARLLGKNVRLAFDWDLRDRYGRLLAYVYTEDGVCHNAELVRQGYGHAYTRFPFQFMDEFRRCEREAREKRRGLWHNE